MQPLIDTQVIRQLLDLHAGGLIDHAIAERQLEVIRKGFNYLVQPGNNALYIADEVGLGKTYIALGIASLLRHFAERPEIYQDVILVPKENLQDKWAREIRQFVGRNYLLRDNRVKSVIGSPVGEICVKDTLRPLENDHPAYHLYRATQFSMGMSSEDQNLGRRELLVRLQQNLSDPLARDILEEAYRLKYFTQARKAHLKKLYAYLLSLCNPPIELLIVDEGHNYKQGVDDEEDDASDRNEVITRFFGMKRKGEDDRLIFDEFEAWGLERLVQPRVQKLIVLSATPKTYKLLELKRQFDLFLRQHALTGCKSDDQVEERLNHFLIRGNMEYVVEGRAHTRNECRLEYRCGGMDPAVGEESCLDIRDDEQAIVMGLVQYQTIRHLEARCNASFELGMLAGFETFRLDQEKNAPATPATAHEYDEHRTRKVRTSQDAEVLGRLFGSYRERFDNRLPPHPKQDALVQGVFERMKKGEKSLVFVRRVASATELEERILGQWEDALAAELRTLWLRRLPSRELEDLLHYFDDTRRNRRLLEQLDSILGEIARRLLGNRSAYSFAYLQNANVADEESLIVSGLHLLHHEYNRLEQGAEFRELLIRQSNRSTMQLGLVDLAYRLLRQHEHRWAQPDAGPAEGDGDEGEEHGRYFFSGYFRKFFRKSFRERLNSVDWFDLNFFLVNERYRLALVKAEDLLRNCQHLATRGVKEVQEAFLKSVAPLPYHDHPLERPLYPETLDKPTLLTRLLLEGCPEELQSFFRHFEGRRPEELFQELRVLATIVKACLRNGSGLLPLFVADRAEGEVADNFLQLINQEGTLLHLVLQEVRTIIRDYPLLRAVNFPEGERLQQVEAKLRFQIPALGITGKSTKLKSNVAAQFRMPGFPYVLVTTDIFREGEDLHTYCRHIYHYGIAWNCSDMEQRTGRIDRINSQAHRSLQRLNQLTPESRIHVFYPYVRNTLEVNQVVRLFEGINSFVQTFNDFTQPIEQQVTASTGDAVLRLPPAIRTPLRSRFDHMHFTGCPEGAATRQPLPLLGDSAGRLEQFLLSVKALLEEEFSFYYGPQLAGEKWQIKADVALVQREGRRGPFLIQIVNTVVPGVFQVDVCAYLFRTSSKIQRLLKGSKALSEVTFARTTVDDFQALRFEVPVNGFDGTAFCRQLRRLLEAADEVEWEVTGEDIVVFG